ncbi:MAG: RNA recognition motif domain-containing protein, partial [candidate division WOR-3 bacterium]
DRGGWQGGIRGWNDGFWLAEGDGGDNGFLGGPGADGEGEDDGCCRENGQGRGDGDGMGGGEDLFLDFGCDLG